MKKLLTLIVIAATAFAVPAGAQIKFGVKGGLNITDMSFSKDVVKTSNQTGFFIGPTLKVKIPIVGLGIDASALYDQRSAETEDINDEDNGIVKGKKITQKAINIPVNLRYDLGLGDLAAIYFAAGPQFGFNLGSKSTKLYEDATEWKFKTSNLSINVGAGVMLLNHLQVGANYNIACGKTGEVTVLKGTKSAFRGRANSWQISAAYYF